jgi:hypothetical protein
MNVAMSGETTWTTEDLATLERAIASGVLTVSYSGPPARSVTYQSMDAMLKALSIIRSHLGNKSGQTVVRYARFRKGC